MTRQTKRSQVDTFMANINKPDPRKSLLMDRTLQAMEPAMRKALTGVLKDKTVSVNRIKLGLQDIGITVSATTISTWRTRHG